MNDAGDWRLRAGTDVSGCAGDSAGGGKSSEHGRDNVGYALADELDVGIVAVVAHPVRDYRRHERFDRAEHRNREGRAEQAVNQVGAESRNLKMRKAARDSAEARADGFDWELEEVDG